MFFPTQVPDKLKNCQNILISGIGGGFDVFAGLPLFSILSSHNVYFANFSFTNLNEAKCEETEQILPSLVRFSGKVINCPKRGKHFYFPEGYLAERTGRDVYAFPRLGVKPRREAYEWLVKELKLDAILLVDGGIDSLMKGNEEGCATILEDSVSLAAVKDLDIVKIIVATGFGTEIEDGMNHYRALENMAELSKEGAFLGAFALTKEDYSFQYMQEIYNYVANQFNHAQSHITPRICQAVNGDFGGDKFICPLMSLIWFYDYLPVLKRNLIIDDQFCKSVTWIDVVTLFRQKLSTMSFLKNQVLPL